MIGRNQCEDKEPIQKRGEEEERGEGGVDSVKRKKGPGREAQ